MATSGTSRPTLRTEIAGVPVEQIAQEFGTPSYVYDAAKIRQRLGDLQAFDTVRYAQKACSNLSILEIVRQEGALVDAVSAGEIHRALAAGYVTTGSPPPVVYTSDIFDEETLDLVVDREIHVNCGSPDMIEQLGNRVQGREITLRINPGFGHGHSQKTNTGGEQSKHGIWHEQLDECVALANKHGLKVAGLHLHIGSGTDLEHLSKVCGAIEELAPRVGETLHSISAGGGLPIRYEEGDEEIDTAQYFRLWDDTRKRIENQLGRKIELEIEPGRYVVAESGYLVCRICAIKKMGDNLFYLLDAGFNALARPILYGAYHPISIVPAGGSSGDRTEQDVVVGGPLCESGDIFTQSEGGFVQQRRLPRAEVGDLLVIECAGAYASVMASNYNSKPLPPEVLVEDQECRLIRTRQSVDDMLRNEQNLSQ